MEVISDVLRGTSAVSDLLSKGAAAASVVFRP